MLLTFLASAWASPPGTFDTDEVAAHSTTYAQASAALQAPLEAANRTLNEVAASLIHYRKGLDFLGDRASQDGPTRWADLRQAHGRNRATLEAFADALIDDFNVAMVDAMDRARLAFPGALPCVSRIADGPSLPGIPARTKPNPECTGQNHSQAIAAAMDADADLSRRVADILARPWPSVDVDRTPVSATPGSAHWIDVAAFVEAAAPQKARDIDVNDDIARAPFEVALTEEPDAASLEALRAEAAAIEANTRQARVALAAPLLFAADLAMAKSEPVPNAGWCAQPATLGGCEGESLSEPMLARIMSHKKVRKAASR